MKTRTWIAGLILLSLTAGLWALSPPATTAVQADDSPQQTRQGAWLDSVVFTEELPASVAISLLQADELDLYAHGCTSPSLFQVMHEDIDENYTMAYGLYHELTFNPNGPEFDDGRLNPFSVTAIREAMNRLVDRNYIAQVILGGLAAPRWVPVHTTSADYARFQATIEALEDAYAYDPVAAQADIAAEMETLGAEMIGGKWYYSGELVTLIALMRDGHHRQIGDYVADQLETIGFTVERQYKPSDEAASCWINGDDDNFVCFHVYVGEWPPPDTISRDEGGNFDLFYTPRGFPDYPLWQLYQPSPEFDEAALRLATKDFEMPPERGDLFQAALGLSINDSGAGSVRIWLADGAGFTPRRADTVVVSDRVSGVTGAEMWPYVARFDGVEGGTMRVAVPSFLDQPWNPVAGSSSIYDMMPIRATQDYAFIHDPDDGLVWPQRAVSADVVVQEGLPVGATHDWVSLSFAPEIIVPGDAWVDWDAEEQRFITADEKYPDGLTARVKSTVYYPDDLFATVNWHDGSPLDLSDFVMNLILTFDRGKPESAIYDESAVAALDDLLSHFRGVRILSADPLVTETYDDNFELDAELIGTFSSEAKSVTLEGEHTDSFWPTCDRGPGAWHNLAVAILAEAAGEMAFSEAKAVALEGEHTDFIAGASLGILESYMDLAATEGHIPYEATLGAYITPEEAAARWANLEAWYAARGHFWLGTGPFYLESADPDNNTLTLQHNPAFPDEAGRWDGFAAAPSPELAINYTSGAPGSYLNVTGSGFPPEGSAFIVVNDHLLAQITVNDTGAVAFTLTTDEADEGIYHLRVSINPSAGLAFVLDEDEEVRPQEGDLPLVEVPDGLITYPVYLPLVLRNWP